MDLVVVKVDDDLIYCATNPDVDPDKNPDSVWTFDRKYGIEDDAELGFGIETRITGSRLLGVIEKAGAPQ